MPDFVPPTGFDDVSSYTFTGQGRRIIIRHTFRLGSAEDLKGVAGDYANQLRQILGVAPKISAVKHRKDQSPYIVVTSRLKEQGESFDERSAFMLFRNGTSAQIACTAPVTDKSAGKFFEMLVQSARPAASEPDKPFAIAAAASRLGTSTKKSTRPAGPVEINLPANYQDATVLRFRTSDGTRQLSVKAQDIDAPKPAALKQSLAAPKAASHLAELVAPHTAATDDRGNTFQYEPPPDLWSASAQLRSRRRAEAETSTRKVGLAAPATTASATGPEKVSTDVREIDGKRVIVHYRSNQVDDSADAKTISRAVKPSGNNG